MFVICWLGVLLVMEPSLGGDEAFVLSRQFGVSVATELSSTATELSSTATEVAFGEGKASFFLVYLFDAVCLETGDGFIEHDWVASLFQSIWMD